MPSYDRTRLTGPELTLSEPDMHPLQVLDECLTKYSELHRTHLGFKRGRPCHSNRLGFLDWVVVVSGERMLLNLCCLDFNKPSIRKAISC